MEWSYIAGFVDGEGSFNVGSYGKQMTLALPQTESRASVLDVIAAHFDEYKITYSWYHGKGNDHTNPYWVLTISAQSSLKKLILHLLPHLIVKRPDAEAALEFLSKKEKAKALRDAECKYGHPRTPENTYTHPKTGKRSCLVCRRERNDARNVSVPGYSGT